MRNHDRRFELAAAALGGGLSVIEIVRLIAYGGVTPGHTLVSSLVGGLGFSFVLAASAVGLLLHRRFGWLFGAIGVVVAAGHGVIVRASGSWIGAGYLFGAFVMFGLIVKSLHAFRTARLAET